jgi:hypothetical protein
LAAFTINIAESNFRHTQCRRSADTGDTIAWSFGDQE